MSKLKTIKIFYRVSPPILFKGKLQEPLKIKRGFAMLNKKHQTESIIGANFIRMASASKQADIST